MQNGTRVRGVLTSTVVREVFAKLSSESGESGKASALRPIRVVGSTDKLIRVEKKKTPHSP